MNVIDCRPQFEFLPNIHELPSGIKKNGDLQTYVIMGNIAVAGLLFAGAKEGIFKAVMVKSDPPSGLTSAINFYNRTSESIFNLALPTLTEFSSLRRLAHVQFLS